MPDSSYRELRAIQGRPIVDKRRGDRHKNRKKYPYDPNKKRSKDLSKWDRRNIVAWDGEGANLSSGTHVYNLLANSDNVRILNHDGLGTEEVLNFFIKYGDPRSINVIYGGSYDINMLLVDVPKEKLAVLWTTGACFWRGFRLWYTPRKKFTVQKFYHVPGQKNLKHITFTLWDVLGYFQTTFVSACRKWLGDLEILDEIEKMKQDRNVFSVDRIAEIIDYNQKECILLVQLMRALFDAMDTADIKLTRYDGAGSIAAALLRKYEIQSHKGKPSDLAKRYAQHAYSGGRIEAPKVGNVEYQANLSEASLDWAIRGGAVHRLDLTYPHLIHRYDINSAYPSILRNLPSYKDAVWTHDTEWNGSENSMVHVRWHIQDECAFYPLWYREHDGTILYPRWGEGIYWGSEVQNLTQNYPDQYEVLDAINVQLANDDKPFSFIDGTYRVRQVFKQAGSMAHEALKLGLSSLYGKLAQQAGFRNGRFPTYHHLLWAGQVTAGTRRQLYLAASQKPETVIAFATDAIMSTSPLKVDVGQGLGEWTYDAFTGITLVQPGVYWLKNQQGWQEKYRGFDKGSLMREQIIECWREGRDYEAHLTRFVGLGSALMSTRFEEVWRTWPTEPRKLSLVPSGKRIPGEETCYSDQLCATIAATNINADVLSMAYPLEWDEFKADIKMKLDGVNVGELEREYLDSYA